MRVRAALLAVTAAALLPLGGTSHASCLDDALARDLAQGHYNEPKSEYWAANYVQHGGTANFAIHGDALVSDYQSFVTRDIPSFTQKVSTNTAAVALTFVDCVAG